MLQLPISKLADEFEVSRQFLTRRFEAAGIKTGRGSQFTIKQAHDALSGELDIKKATEKAKLKNLEEDGMLKEIERRQKEGEVVLMTEVNDLMVKTWEPVAKAIKDMDAKLAPRVNPTDQVLARDELAKYKRKLCKDITDRCSRLKKKRS